MRTSAMALLLVLTAGGPAAADEPVLTLEAALGIANERNTAVALARSEVAAAQARLRGAAVLTPYNPELEAAAGARRSGPGPIAEYEFRVTQAVELGGQRAARIDSANSGLSMSRARLEAERASLLADVRKAFARALASARLLAMERESSELTARTEETARMRLTAGEASRIDLNIARVELGRAQASLRDAERRHEEALFSLRLVLGVPETFKLGRLEEPSHAGHIAELQHSLDDRLRRHPSVVAELHAVEEARAELALSRREFVPTPRVGVTWSQEQDEQVLRGTLSVGLPLFNQNQGARGLATVRLAREERQLEGALRRVRNAVAVARTRHSAAISAAADLGGQALAAAEENLELINTAYSIGKVDVLRWILVRRETLEARRACVAALEELAIAEADLAEALGIATMTWTATTAEPPREPEDGP